MPHPRRWLILAVLCLTMLVAVIDNMVLNIAIPALIRDLGASHGMSPRALCREARRRRALGLLHGDATLAGIAAQAGFADQSHFSRTCRLQAGTTPTALRRQIKCVQDLDGPGRAQ